MSMSVRNGLRALTPPLVWQFLKRLSGRPPLRSYQGVVTPFDMSALHTGRFADVFDAANRNDPTCSSDLLRLRAYLAYLFAEVARRVRGDYLAAGISFAVAEKVVYELTLKGTARTFHLIDPFLDHRDTGYCKDPAFVADLFGRDAAVRFHLAAIPDAFPITLPDGLAFAHLDTGDEDAELASLPYLVGCMNQGGVIVIDSYGLGQFAARYDAVAQRCGAAVFTLPTGQGVLMRSTNVPGWE